MKNRCLLSIASCGLGLMLSASVSLDAQKKRSKPTRNAVMTVTATAYCITGTTESGTQTRRGIVAADPKVLPLGSVVRVEGLKGRYNGTYKVEDTGRAVKGNTVDIFIPSCEAAEQFGRQTAKIRVLERGPEPSPSGG
jgi:3D (Asp-Asp-Asp) domain-containing protein